MKTEMHPHVPASNPLLTEAFLVKAMEDAIVIPPCALGAGLSPTPRAPEDLTRVLMKNYEEFFDKGRLGLRGDTNKARGLPGVSDIHRQKELLLGRGIVTNHTIDRPPVVQGLKRRTTQEWNCH